MKPSSTSGVPAQAGEGCLAKPTAQCGAAAVVDVDAKRRRRSASLDRMASQIDRFRQEQERGRAALLTSRRVKKLAQEGYKGRSMGVFSEPTYIGVGTKDTGPSPFDPKAKINSTGAIFSLDASGRLKGQAPVPLEDGSDYRPSWCPTRSTNTSTSVSNDMLFSRAKLMANPAPPAWEALRLVKIAEDREERSQRLSAREKGVRNFVPSCRVALTPRRQR